MRFAGFLMFWPLVAASILIPRRSSGQVEGKEEECLRNLQNIAFAVGISCAKIALVGDANSGEIL